MTTMTLEVAPETAARLEALRARAGAADRTVLFRRALAAFAKLYELRDGGADLVVRDRATGDERGFALAPDDDPPAPAPKAAALTEIVACLRLMYTDVLYAQKQLTRHRTTDGPKRALDAIERVAEVLERLVTTHGAGEGEPV